LIVDITVVLCNIVPHFIHFLLVPCDPVVVFGHTVLKINVT
jgi:hypothetical protein